MRKPGFRRLLAIVCAMMFLLTACAGGIGLLATTMGPISPISEEGQDSARTPTPTPVSAAPLPTAPTAPPPQDSPPETENPLAQTPEPEDLPEDFNLSEAPEVWTPLESRAVSSTQKIQLPKELPDFYIAENKKRYLTFAASYPDIPFDVIVAYVNTGVDIPHYTDTILIDDPNNILVICNKTYRLSSKYAPKDLVSIAGNKSMVLRDEAAAAWKKMYNDMKDEGLRVYPISAYRSYSRQKAIYQNYAAKSGASRADTYSARAGHSEHQTGLTLDMLHVTSASSLTGAHFENTKQYKWLCKYAADYGYILRYPKDYEHITGYRYEPWHWRYVGVEAAQQMKAEKIATWEEYCGRYAIPEQIS